MNEEAMNEETQENGNIERVKAIATIVVVAVVNVLNVLGYAMDAEPYVNAITSVCSAVGIAWAWWKNQNVTVEAQQAQVYLDGLKAARHAKDAE
jgi:hypothetical protein